MAQVDSRGYASLMGVAPDSEILDFIATPEEAPLDGQTRVFTDEDGTQHLIQNGMEVCKILPKGGLGVTGAQKEAREASAVKEISEWQKRVAARSADVNIEKPPYEVKGQDGLVWHITQPAATSTFAIQGLIGARIMGDNAAPDISDEEIKVLSGAALLFLFTVCSKEEPKLLFRDIDDALAFMDASETGLDAIRILGAINKRYSDFLAELSLIG